MARFISSFFVLVLLVQPAAAQSADYWRTNPEFLRMFRDILRSPAQSVVRVQCDKKDTCLGIVVAADGWILTKAHDLTGAIQIKLKDGSDFDAKLVGVHEEHDLALLKIDSQDLTPITWSHSDKVRSGSWVAAAGLQDDPVAVGVVGVGTREVLDAYLGVVLEPAPEGLLITNVLDKSAAFKAGLRPKDMILRVNGRTFNELESFSEMLARHRPGQTITLAIRRADMEKEVRATLLSREAGGGFRAEFQNRLGSELSKRRGGYPVILQHDGVVRPSDCGGPLVDLHGHVVGINISRAGRVETWAVPAEVASSLIADLKTAKYAPKVKKLERAPG
jgi:serine protease Do